MNMNQDKKIETALWLLVVLAILVGIFLLFRAWWPTTAGEKEAVGSTLSATSTTPSGQSDDEMPDGKGRGL